MLEGTYLDALFEKKSYSNPRTLRVEFARIKLTGRSNVVDLLGRVPKGTGVV